MNNNKYSETCCYNENTAMLYAVMPIDAEHKILLSANEFCLFDRYLAFAKNNDKEIVVDMETADFVLPQIVYGSLMFYEKNYEHVKEYVEELRGYAMIDLDREVGKLTASTYEDIILFPENSKMKNFIPFAALMKTTHKFEDINKSVTMFPYTGGLVWEDMVNRNFLLACRKMEPVKEYINTTNWKNYIQFNEMMEAYAVADIYTGPSAS